MVLLFVLLVAAVATCDVTSQTLSAAHSHEKHRPRIYEDLTALSVVCRNSLTVIRTLCLTA
jgi:hypothetical protein